MAVLWSASGGRYALVPHTSIQLIPFADQVYITFKKIISRNNIKIGIKVINGVRRKKLHFVIKYALNKGREY